MKLFDGQQLWVIVSTQGGVFQGSTASSPAISVLLIDWDEFSFRRSDATIEEMQETVLDGLRVLRERIPPGKTRKNYRFDMVDEYRQQVPRGINTQ